MLARLQHLSVYSKEELLIDNYSYVCALVYIL